MYDIKLDPNERTNLASDPAVAEVIEEMRGRLQLWMEVTSDPLLAGRVVAPAGALVNSSTDPSPYLPPRPAN